MGRPRRSRNDPPTFQCEGCGGMFSRSLLLSKGGKNNGFNYKQRFCTKSCMMQHRGRMRAELTGVRGHVSKVDGYRRMCWGKRGTYRNEHLVVMEKMIGRPLLKGETVHHKNGVRHDNRPENLELWTSRHGKGQRAEDRIVNALAILDDYGIRQGQPSIAEYSSAMLSLGG